MRWRREPCERGAREGRGPAAGHGRDPGPLHRRRGSRVAALVSAPWAGSRSRARHVSRRALTGGDRGPGSPAGRGSGGDPARRFGDGIRCGADAPRRCPATARTAAVDALGAGDFRKPDPEPYLLAASRLGLAPADCLVFEDAPAGIASALQAGCQVVQMGGTRRYDDRLKGWLRDWRGIEIEVTPDGLHLHLPAPLPAEAG